MYSVGMRIPTGTGAFVGGSHSFGQPAVPEAPVDKLQLLENYLPGLCPARMRLPSSKLHRLPDGACGWQIEGRSAATLLSRVRRRRESRVRPGCASHENDNAV